MARRFSVEHPEKYYHFVPDPASEPPDNPRFFSAGRIGLEQAGSQNPAFMLFYGMLDENKNKYDFLSLLLSEGDAMVCVDARQEGVDVPKAHKTNPSLNLVFNLSFKRPLDIAPEGIHATLAFDGRPHPCVIPFESVWAIYDPSMKNGQVWEDSLPPDLHHEMQAFPTAKRPPALAAMSVRFSGKSGAPSDAPRAKRDRSHLRVIK